MSNGINVEYTLITKKSKSDKGVYFIYISFVPHQFGVRQLKAHIISTGISVNSSEWQRGKVKGKGLEANNINSKLMELQTSTNNFLVTLSTKNYETCSEIMAEIKCNAKLDILGKAPKGKQVEIVSRLKQYSYENIMNKLFVDRNISAGRKRGYSMGLKLLNEYFNGNIPTINLISDTELLNFKKWFKKKHTCSNNTLTDYLSKIAAVFKYAQELKILSSSPLPRGFRGSWEEGKRQVLSEKECLSIMNIDDSTLSKTELVTKYSILVQMLTGMGYGDMESMTYENIKFDSNLKQYFLNKERNKTKVEFKVYSTANARYMIDKLIDLTGDASKPFNLPTIDYANRQYKIISQKAGIPFKVTTYTLRHTYAVNYMESDGRIEDLAENLGQKDLRTTQIYGKISKKRLAEKSKELQSKSIIHQIQSQHNNLKVV